MNASVTLRVQTRFAFPDRSSYERGDLYSAEDGEDMGAGDSAREVAARAAEAEKVLRKKADSAARMSHAFSLGADGEVTVAETLAPLAARGWFVLSDRESPHGGNVDDVLIGPGGVIVIDAKNWSYAVRVKGDDIFTGNFSRRASLNGVLRQIEEVKASLANIAFATHVRGMLVLVGESDRGRNLDVIRGVGLVGLDRVADELDQMEVQLTPSQIEEVFRALSLEFPPMEKGAPQPDRSQRTPLKVRKLFDKNARFFYIHQWKKSGKFRLYLKASDGNDLGWKDVNTGLVTLSCGGDDAKLARAVLESATPTGVTLAAENLPKIALAFPGGKLLAKLGPVGAPVLVGQEWRSRGVYRLYGTLIYPGDAAYALGFVDLSTGKFFPSVEGKLGKDYAPAVNYLQLLDERRPKAEVEGRS